MKTSLLFVFVFFLICPMVICQNLSDEVLLLVKGSPPSCRIIEKNQKIWLKTDQELSFRDEIITNILGDTIFFNEGYITVSHITGIKMYVYENIREYDLSTWRIIVPPEEVCKSYEMLREFGRWAGYNMDKDGKYNLDDWLNSTRYRVAEMLSSKSRILISRRHHHDLFKIAEGQEKEIWLHGDVMFRTYDITRIRFDSIYLNDAGYKFEQIDSLCLDENKNSPFGRLNFTRSDTIKWEVIFPPEPAYFSRRSFSSFMNSLEKRKKREIFEWRTPPFNHNMIKWNFRLALIQIVMAYEFRFTKKWSVEIEGGYQFKAGSQLTPAGPGKLLPYYRFKGPLTQMGVKYYFNGRGYVESLLHYNYLVLDSAVSKLPTGTICLQDQFRNEFGLSLRVGKLTRMGSLLVDGYMGLGIRLVATRRFAYGYYYQNGTNDYYFRWYNDQHIPIVDDFLTWEPILSIGIKIGGGF